ncbi:MAG: hypothetical protein H7257_13885 [Taibaiella sp.]|nr:hypothetical protein [Taibaiella sp.]
MKLKLKLVTGVLAVLCAGCAVAKTKKTTKTTNLKLVEAYTQRTLAGIPGAPPAAGQHFVVVWNAKTYPESFFWRGENGWLTCSIEKTHKIPKSEIKNYPGGVEYRNEDVSGDEIHKGDTLMLTPLKGGKFPVPAEIPVSAKNTLYYKTGGSKWIAFKVATISKKRDIATP